MLFQTCFQEKVGQCTSKIIKDQTACSVQSDLDLLCPQKVSVSRLAT